MMRKHLTNEHELNVLVNRLMNGMIIITTVGTLSYFTNPEWTKDTVEKGYQRAGEIIEKLNPIPTYHVDKFQRPIASAREDAVCSEDITTYHPNKEELKPAYQ